MPAPVTAAPPPPTLLGRSPTRVEAQGTVTPHATVAPPAAGRGPWIYIVAAVVLVGAGGALGWYLTHGNPATRQTSPSPAAVLIELAQRSLDARDYNRALDQAEQALRVDSTSTEARRLMELARAGLAAQTAHVHDADVPPAPTAAPPVVKASPSPTHVRASVAPPTVPPAPPTTLAYVPPPTTVAATTLPPPPVTPPPTPPPTTVAVTVPPTTVAPPPVVNEDLAVRRVVEEYGRAIEQKDLALFKKLYPGLSPDGEKKLRDAFQGGGAQIVRITIADVQISGAQATVHLSRQDTIDGQSRTFQQTVLLSKSQSGWIIREIGR